MTVDSLTISSVADPIKGGAIVLGDKNSVLGSMNLVVKNTQLVVTDNNIEHGIVVGTYTTRGKLTSTISDSLVKFKSTGAVSGNSVGILSEGGVDVAGQSHTLNLSNVTVDMEAMGGQFASGILAQTQPSTIGGAAAKLIDIELSGINQIQVAYTGADGLYAAGIDASKGDNEQVIIHEQDAGGSIQASATQGTTATYGIFANSSLTKGKNTITSRSTISSISAGGMPTVSVLRGCRALSSMMVPFMPKQAMKLMVFMLKVAC